MIYVLYIDILFFINAWMNTLIFYCVTITLNHTIRFRKVIIGSIMASVLYCVFTVVPILQTLPYFLHCLFIPIPSILYLYKPKSIKQYVKYYLISLFIAAVFGGISFNILYIFNGMKEIPINMNIGILVLIGIGVTLCFKAGFYCMRRRFIYPNFEYELALENNNQWVNIKALLDTGNLLYTPITHEPVIVVEYAAIKAILSEEEKQNYMKYGRDSNNHLEEDLLNGISTVSILIPFNSIGCKMGYLLGVRIDKVLIKREKKKTEYQGCIIGICNQKIVCDKGYHALLHPEFILNGEMAI